MRADRLLSALLVLQAHGKQTGRELAARLEVSERTVHRDMEALSAAGVPVFAMRGVRGGWQLDDEWRTEVPGLDDVELRALLMAQPRIVGDARLAAAAERALNKLMAALPAALRERAALMRQRLYVDTTGWNGHSREPCCPSDRAGCADPRSQAADLVPSTRSRAGGARRRSARPRRQGTDLVPGCANRPRVSNVPRVDASKTRGYSMSPAIAPPISTSRRHWKTSTSAVHRIATPPHHYRSAGASRRRTAHTVVPRCAAERLSLGGRRWMDDARRRFRRRRPGGIHGARFRTAYRRCRARDVAAAHCPRRRRGLQPSGATDADVRQEPRRAFPAAKRGGVTSPADRQCQP